MEKKLTVLGGGGGGGARGACLERVGRATLNTPDFLFTLSINASYIFFFLSTSLCPHRHSTFQGRYVYCCVEIREKNKKK